MEDQFRELYKLSNTPDNESVQMATEQLIELYNNPESIFSLLTLMSPNEGNELRSAAAIGFKTTLQKCWEEVQSSEHLQEIKDNMIELLSNEQDYRMRYIILDAMAPIFSSEIEDWPQLTEFIESISNETDEPNIELFLSIFTAILQYLPITFIASQFDNLLTKAKTAISAQSIPVVLAGSNLLRAILNLIIPQDQEIITSVLVDMLEVFYNLLKENSPIAGEILNDICLIIAGFGDGIVIENEDEDGIIESNNFFESVQPLLEQYYAIISDDEVDALGRHLCTQLLCTLIKQYPKELESEYSQIITSTIELASLVATDDCFESQIDLFYAVSPIEELSINISPNDFFDIFWTEAQTDSPNKLLATAAAVSSYIEHIPEVISLNFPEIFDFSIGCIQNSEHYIQESGFSIIFQLISQYHSLFSDLFDKFMETVLPILQESDHEPLLLVTLSSLVELLYLVEVPDSYIEPLLESYVSLFSKISSMNQYLIVSSIASLIYSSEECIKEQQVATDLITILQEAADHDPSQEPLIAAYGIEAFSYLISFSPSDTAPIHQFTLDKIHEYLQLEDASLFSSIMISLGVLISSEGSEFIDNIDPEILFGAIMKFLGEELETIAKDTAVYSSIIESKKTSLKFLAKLASLKPSIVTPYAPNVSQFIINHFDLKIEDYYMLKASFKASISMAQLMNGLEEHEAFESFIEKLIRILEENFESPKQETASLSFYGFSRLIDLGLELEESTMSSVISFAFNTLNLELSCQQNEEEMMSIQLSDEVFDFFAMLAQKLPQLFPLEDFFNFTQEVYEKWKNGEIEVERISILVECIGVLCELFDVSPGSFQSLFKITLHQWFIETLKICEEFEFPPHPFSAVRCFIEEEKSIKEEDMKVILSIVESTFSAEFNGQTYYSNTISSAISLLFSMIRIVVSSSNGESVDFDFDSFLPKMLEFLPKNIIPSEAGNILDSIIWCAEKIPDFLQSYEQEVFRILTVILGMKRKKLTKLKISDETMNHSIQLLNEILQNEQESEDLINSWLDKFALIRFQERISPSE